MNTETAEELQARLAECIAKMEHASNVFYGLAVRSGNHAFIEFCGLQNEFISICRDAAKAGIDFTLASTHTGVALPIASYQFNYLAEKLNCIYGPSLTSDPKMFEEFVTKIAGD